MPDNYGWKRDCDKYISVMTTLPPDPETPLQLIKCGCSKNSEYDQEISYSQTTVNPMAHLTITRHQEDKLSKSTSSLYAKHLGVSAKLTFSRG